MEQITNVDAVIEDVVCASVTREQLVPAEDLQPLDYSIRCSTSAANDENQNDDTVDDQNENGGTSDDQNQNDSTADEDIDIDMCPTRFTTITSICDASSGITLSFEHIHGPTKMMKLQQLAQQFGITISYDKDIVGTYLVADCETILTRTKLVGWALLLNIPIVTFQWVVDSLAAMSLQPVHEYMLDDISGEQAALSSWRVGRGIIHERMEWVQKCMMLLSPTVEYSDDYCVLLDWAKVLGFRVTKSFRKFREAECSLKLVLIDTSNVESDDDLLPDTDEINDWLRTLGAITIQADWFFECVYRYKFVEITSSFLIQKFRDQTDSIVLF